MIYRYGVRQWIEIVILLFSLQHTLILKCDKYLNLELCEGSHIHKYGPIRYFSFLRWRILRCFHFLCSLLLFFNKLRQIIPEIRSERWDLHIFIFILKRTGTFTPVHSAGYLILRNEFRSTQEIARQNIQVSIYIRSTGLWPNAWIHVSQSLAIIRNAEYTFCDLLTNP